jgi:hypothetical protein
MSTKRLMVPWVVMVVEEPVAEHQGAVIVRGAEEGCDAPKEERLMLVS